MDVKRMDDWNGWFTNTGVSIKSSKKDKNKNKHQEGIKTDEDKAPLSLLFLQFPDAMKAIAKRAMYGHKKYKKTDADFMNWRRVKNAKTRYLNAGLRHLSDHIEGKLIDEDSGQPHLWAALWNIAAATQLNEEKIKKLKI